MAARCWSRETSTSSRCTKQNSSRWSRRSARRFFTVEQVLDAEAAGPTRSCSSTTATKPATRRRCTRCRRASRRMSRCSVASRPAGSACQAAGACSPAKASTPTAMVGRRWGGPAPREAIDRALGGIEFFCFRGVGQGTSERGRSDPRARGRVRGSPRGPRTPLKRDLWIDTLAGLRRSRSRPASSARRGRLRPAGRAPNPANSYGQRPDGGQRAGKRLHKIPRRPDR